MMKRADDAGDGLGAEKSKPSSNLFWNDPVYRQHWTSLTRPELAAWWKCIEERASGVAPAPPRARPRLTTGPDRPREEETF